MPLCLHQVKGKHWKSQGGGLDWIIQSQFTVAVLSCRAPVSFQVKKYNETSTPPPGLSYPAPLRTPCCRTAAVGPDVSAPSPLPRCPCCPRCQDGQMGDTARTGWGKERQQAAGWAGGRHLSSGSPLQQRQGWPDRGPGSWYFLHCLPWVPSVLATA